MSANASYLNNIPTRLCLNQLSRPDRWKQAKDEFARVGITADQFLSLPGDSPFQSFNRSQKAMIAEIEHLGYPGITFEDDVIFRHCDHLQEAMQELPQNWHILYFGANLLDPAPKRFSKHLFRIQGAWTTHAVAYNREVIDYILKNFDADANHMYDDFLSREIHSKFNVFITFPTICWQRPGVMSDLWGRHTDYTPAFADADNKMRVL